MAVFDFIRRVITGLESQRARFIHILRTIKLGGSARDTRNLRNYQIRADFHLTVLFDKEMSTDANTTLYRKFPSFSPLYSSHRAIAGNLIKLWSTATTATYNQNVCLFRQYSAAVVIHKLTQKLHLTGTNVLNNFSEPSATNSTTNFYDRTIGVDSHVWNETNVK